jgi:hypothetical protein
MDGTMIRMSRVMPVAIGLVGLGVVALCVPLLVVAARQVFLLAILAAVLVWLAYVCLRLVLTRTELHVDEHGVLVVGGRRRVAWAWQDVATVGVLRHKAHEFLALRLADGRERPRLGFFLYPSWSDEVNAVVLGRLDYFPTPRREIDQLFRRHAGDRWTADLSP